LEVSLSPGEHANIVKATDKISVYIAVIVPKDKVYFMEFFCFLLPGFSNHISCPDEITHRFECCFGLNGGKYKHMQARFQNRLTDRGKPANETDMSNVAPRSGNRFFNPKD